jgi:CBS domain-containing protein
MADKTLDQLFAPDVDSIESGEPASHAKRRMDTNETRSLLVVDDGQLIGLIRRNSLLKISDEELEKPVSEFMTRDVPQVKQSQSVEDAHASLGGDINIEQVPVLDENGSLVGVVNRPDLAAASASAATPYGGDNPPADRIPVEQGMTVKDSTGSKLGEVAEVNFQADGGVEFLTIEHGLIFKKQKKFPGEVVDRVEGDELLLAISSTEFGMVKDLGEE